MQLLRSRWLFLFALSLASCRVSEALTLSEALRGAAENNETVRIAAARVAQARALKRGALAALLPSATATYAYTMVDKEIVRTVDGEREVVVPKDSRNADLTLDLELFDFANIPRVQGALKDLQAERYDSVEAHRSLAFEVAAAFFEVLSGERQAEAARHRQSVAQQFVTDTRDKVEAGLANRNELTRLELELASAELVRTQADNALTNARLLLGYLMGRDVDEPLEEPAATAAIDTTRDETIDVSLRPDFRSAQLRADAARARAREPWLDWFPDLGLRMTYYAPDDWGITSANDWQFGATFTWDLFDPGLIANTGLRAAQHSEFRALAQAVRRQVRLDRQTAQSNLQSAQAALSQAEVRVRVAEQNADEVRERFRLGLATALEQADANVSEFEARAEFARRRFGLQQALLERVRAQGLGPQAIFTESE